MSVPIIPKAENANKGFHYTVTDEQIKEHRKLSVKEIFEWLENTSKFIYEIQTPEERERMKTANNFYCHKVGPGNIYFIAVFKKGRGTVGEGAVSPIP